MFELDMEKRYVMATTKMVFIFIDHSIISYGNYFEQEHEIFFKDNTLSKFGKKRFMRSNFIHQVSCNI